MSHLRYSVLYMCTVQYGSFHIWTANRWKTFCKLSYEYLSNGNLLHIESSFMDVRVWTIFNAFFSIRQPVFVASSQSRGIPKSVISSLVRGNFERTTFAEIFWPGIPHLNANLYKAIYCSHTYESVFLCPIEGLYKLIPFRLSDNYFIGLFMVLRKYFFFNYVHIRMSCYSGASCTGTVCVRNMITVLHSSHSLIL